MTQSHGLPVILLLCATCDGTDRVADRVADRGAVEQALGAHGLAGLVRVAMTECMGACENPVSLGLQGAGRASYVFAGVEPQKDAVDIARTCQSYLDAPAGWIEDARGCGRLRDCLRARLPAISLVATGPRVG